VNDYHAMEILADVHESCAIGEFPEPAAMPALAKVGT
jgi:hypothetical protein